MQVEGVAARSDEELLLSVAGRRDREAFAVLYDRTVGLVYANVRRILEDATQSDEVTQQTFLDVAGHAGSFDPDRCSARIWLLTLAHQRTMQRVASARATDKDPAHQGDARRTTIALPVVRVVQIETSVHDRLDQKRDAMRRMPNKMTRRRPTASMRHRIVLTLFVLLVVFASTAASHAQQAPVGLGTADSFAVLAGETITNTGPTTITGDVGLHPGDSVTGFEDVTLNGELHLADAVALQAKNDLVTAYDDATGRSPTTTVPTELGGQTLPGGAYDSESGTFQITGMLTLDAEGDPASVWVFQAASTLTTAAASDVNLVNGADACNVYWQVGSSATLGTGSSFTGSILALTSITLTTDATLQGRALARNGAVTLDTNTITRPACAAPDDDDDAGTAPDDDATETAPDDDNGIATPEDDDTTTELVPAPVQPPTRIDTGGGGATPPASRTGVLLMLAVAVAVATVTLLHRVANGR